MSNSEDLKGAAWGVGLLAFIAMAIAGLHYADARAEREIAAVLTPRIEQWAALDQIDPIAKIAARSLQARVEACMRNHVASALHRRESPNVEDIEASCVYSQVERYAIEAPAAAAGIVELARSSGMLLPQDLASLVVPPGGVAAFAALASISQGDRP